MADVWSFNKVEGARELPETVLRTIYGRAETINVPLGGVIAHADSAPDELFVVRSGLIVLFHEETGGALTPFQGLGPGEMFGLGSLVLEQDSGRSAPLTARALMPSVVLRLPSEASLAALDDGGMAAAAYRRLRDSTGSRLEVGLLLAESSVKPLSDEAACPCLLQMRMSLVLSTRTRQVLGACALVGACPIGKKHGCPLAALQSGRPPVLWPLAGA